MTEFSIPPLVIGYGSWWIDVDLREDPRTWAERTAPEILARWGEKGGRRRKHVAKVLAAAAQAARRGQDATAVFLLYPELDGEVRAFARLIPVDLSGHDEESAWKAMLESLVPVQGDATASGTEEITDIATPAGPCKRIRYQEPIAKDNPGIGEHLVYVWALAQYGAGVLLTTWFADLAEAGRWRSAIDELAASASLDETAT